MVEIIIIMIIRVICRFPAHDELGKCRKAECRKASTPKPKQHVCHTQWCMDRLQKNQHTVVEAA